MAIISELTTPNCTGRGAASRLRVTVRLTEEDYLDFSYRVARRQEPGRGSRAVHWFGIVGAIVALSVALVYINRVMLGRSTSVLETFWPSIVVLVIAWIYIEISSSRKVRQILAPVADGFILGETHFDFSPDGIQEKGRNHSASISWAAVLDIVDAPDHIYIVLDTALAIILPKRCLESEERADELLAYLQQLWQGSESGAAT